MSASAKGSACCADDEAKTCVEGVKLPELAVPFVPRTTLEISADLSDDALNGVEVVLKGGQAGSDRFFLDPMAG